MHTVFRRSLLLLLMLQFMLPLHAAPAREPASAADTPATESATTAQAAPETGPVPIPEATPLARQRYRSGNLIWVAGAAMNLLIPVILLATGWSARLRDFARRIGRRWYFTVCIYFVVLLLAVTIVSLPWSYYVEFAREHAYGLSNETRGKWFRDKAIATGLLALIGVLFLWVPYLLLRRSPRRWWLYTGLLAFPFFLFLLLIAPIWIEPLFNDYGPMKDKRLEARILALADRAGIKGGRVYEVNKSEETKTVNAYVTGFLGTERIVLWDTIIQKLDDEELLFVMGHEMGHYVLHHAIKTVFYFSAGLLFILYAAHRAAKALLRRYGKRWGFGELSDIASLPLLMLLVQAGALIADPAALAYSRHNEHEADRFGLELTHENHAAATAFVKLTNENLAMPAPGWLYTAWRASHPSIAGRIRFMNTYKPWEEGKEGKYTHLFE